MVQELPLDALRQIDVECDRFEQEWRGGKRPSLEEYLMRHDAALRPRLLESLQQVQQELLLGKMVGGSPAAGKGTSEEAGAPAGV